MSAITKMILAAASKLPPFPKVAQKVMELLRDPDVSVDELVDVVQMDPTLTANVLKAVNSPIFGVIQKVNNLPQALALLGNETFSEVVFTSASAKLLGQNQSGYDLDQGELWQHSLAVALMSQLVCGHLEVRQSQTLYTAALLHDIGKVALSTFVERKYQQILDDVKQGESFLEAERAVLGMDHAELGAKMVESWNLSEQMAELIRYHHDASARPENTDLAILYVSNVACQMIGLGGGADGVPVRWQEPAIEKLGLKAIDLEVLMAELAFQLDRAQSLLTLSG